MSFPNIPNVTPSIDINREDVINLLLASIAFEELGLAHIINAEAEKIQAVLGTLPESSVRAGSVADLIAINDSVNQTLKTVIKKEMLLQFKLEDILDIPTCQVSVIARLELPSQPGATQYRFFGNAQGTNQVSVEILVNENVVGSTTANVANNQFQAVLFVPVVPGQITIRVRSLDGDCEFERLVTSIPLIPAQ
ncbi:hypothetical protein [Neobacillus sp. D3-1R]|uniref:hypothetical protein n=1 Tax=Neobacillus sp. D3-1R TaxID=3445778 RepID=UPI003FA09E0F